MTVVIPAIPPLPPLSSAGVTPSVQSTPPSGGDGFSNVVAHAVDALQSAQASAAQAEAQAAAGQGSLADTMIAASKASLDTQVTTSLLDKAVTSYNEIMNMSF